MWCRGRGGGGVIIGHQNPTQIMASPLPVIKIVKYCGVRGGEGGIAGRENLTKDNGTPSLCHYKIVKYCGVGGGGGGALIRGRQNPTQIMAPRALSLSSR